MNIAIDSRSLRLVGKGLVYLVGAVILGLATTRILGDEMAKTFSAVLAVAFLFGIEEGLRRGRLKSDGADSQSRKYFWLSYGVAIWALAIWLTPHWP